jgi:hypothetical protein
MSFRIAVPILCALLSIYAVHAAIAAEDVGENNMKATAGLCGSQGCGPATFGNFVENQDSPDVSPQALFKVYTTD